MPSPRPRSNSGVNSATKTNAGTAISGWGTLEKMLQSAARPTPTPRGTRTRLMASPSGMLWTARARAINSPSDSLPPKETPIATPSVKEWIVITPTTSTALRASSAPMLAKTAGCSSCWITRLVTTIKRSPSRTPDAVRHGP